MIPGPPLIPPEAYRRLSDDFPQPVALLATRSGKWDLVTVIDSFLDVSYDPPTMLVSLYRESRAAEAVQEHGSGSLTILSSDQVGLADRFSEPGLPLQGMLNGVPHTRDAHNNALIHGGITYFSLVVQAVYEAATHDLVVCKVSGAQRGSGNEPLVRFAKKYRTLQP